MSKPNANSNSRQGDILYAQMDKMNPELFSLTYGAFVMQLIRDHQDLDVVNTELYKIGYNMGVRLVDEFFARSQIEQCANFTETVNVIATAAFKMFLGIDAEVSRASSDHKTFTIAFKNNPLTDFVELPQGMERLTFSNVICGAITGSLRMLSLVVECSYITDKLKTAASGGELDEIQIKLIDVVNEGYVDDDI